MLPADITTHQISAQSDQPFMCYEIFLEKSPKQKMSITQEPIIGSSWNLVCGNIFRVYYYVLLWQKALKPILTGICISTHFLQNSTLNSKETNISVRVKIEIWTQFRVLRVCQTGLALGWSQNRILPDQRAVCRGMVEQTEHQHTLKCTSKYNLTLPLGISTRVEWLHVRRHSKTAVGKVTKH